jgi:PIN domain
VSVYALDLRGSSRSAVFAVRRAITRLNTTSRPVSSAAGSMGCMRLRHGVDKTIERLTYLNGQLGNCRAGMNAADTQERWLRWWSEADRHLQDLFVDGEVVASLYVSSERVRHLDIAVLPYGVLNHEIDSWVTRFEAMIAELAALKPFIERPGHIVVPDTSAFIEGAIFTELNWQAVAGVGAGELVRLVVPVLVIEELDDHKRSRDRVQRRARSVLHSLWNLNGGNPEHVSPLPGGRPVTVEVLTDDSWHVRRPVNDNEIIERALSVGDITGRNVLLAAADYSMLYQASSAGLKTALVDRPDEAADSATPELASSANRNAH